MSTFPAQKNNPESVSGHQLPPEEARPTEDPPSYDAVLMGSPNAGTSIDSNIPRISHAQLTTLQAQQAQQNDQRPGQSSIPTPRPPPRPPAGRPNIPQSRPRCEKCRDTGIKPSGRICRRCDAGRQQGYQQGYQQQYYRPPVQQVPYAAGPRVVRPGDPSIGGLLCQYCRGSGIVSELIIFESTCPICNGIGRVFPRR